MKAIKAAIITFCFWSLVSAQFQSRAEPIPGQGGLAGEFITVAAGQEYKFSHWSDTYFQQARLGANTLFTLGIKDNSDAEFAQRDFLPDFYPGIQPASQFAKELNLGWYPHQYLHFPLTQFEANHGLSFHLDPAWNNGAGTLRVAVDVWTGKDWLEAGSTLLNMTEAGYVDLPPCSLKVGMNDIRLRVVSGTGGTTVVTWDQIKILLAPFSPVWQLGDNDGSAEEFNQTDFVLVYNPDTDPVSRFPKEINTTWYPNQYLRFTLSSEQAQKAATVSLDVFWNDGAGALTVAVERWDGSSWIAMGKDAINSIRPGKIVIPAYHLKEGLNEWRLTAVSGSDGTSVVVWDSIAIYQRQALPESVAALLGEVLDTTLNYFLSPKAMTESGLPLTALKVTDRARFGYSNPTEWGYALQAWLVAAERGLITRPQAIEKIDCALSTMERLQSDPQQFKLGMFYPFYIVTDSAGNDIPLPYHDKLHELPSGDCALLWGSLNVVEGWLREQGYTAEAEKANLVKSKLNFRTAYFVENERHYISMTVNADTSQRNPYTWLYWADEGGVVNMICYLSGSNSWEEFEAILNTQERPSRSWNWHTTRESAYFNAMFSWGQRSLLGFPMLGSAKERAYGIYSFIPAVAAHLDYGDWLGIDYPGFSDAMTQTFQNNPLVGRFTPPNIRDVVVNSPLLPSHITPHALAIPFCALDALDEPVLRRLFEKWVLLKCDTSGVWHPTHSQDPFGFEVVTNPYLNRSDYAGPDEGRYIFETLSQAYTALSIYEGLARYSSKRTFNHFARQAPGFTARVAEMLSYVYQQD